jgi:chromosome segregation ATPase
VSALEEQTSSKKFSEEAVATVSKIINDAILERNDSFVQEKDKLETEKAELAKAAEENAEEVKQLREELETAKERVSELEQSQKQQEAVARFDSRMSVVEDIYELDDESRKVVASELKNLDESEEAFAAFQEKLQVVLKHQNKEFIAQQQEEFNSKLAEAVEKRLEELKSGKETEEEVVEEAIDSVEAEEEVVANNNAESSEKELSLKDKFQKAFSEDNLTINY